MNETLPCGCRMESVGDELHFFACRNECPNAVAIVLEALGENVPVDVLEPGDPGWRGN